MLSDHFSKQQRRRLLTWVIIKSLIAILCLSVNAIKVTSKYICLVRITTITVGIALVINSISELHDWTDNDGENLSDIYQKAASEVAIHEIGYRASQKIKPYLEPETFESDEFSPEEEELETSGSKVKNQGDQLAFDILKACQQKQIFPAYVTCQESPTAYRLFFNPNHPDDDQKIAKLPLKRITKSSQSPRIFSENGYLVIEVSKGSDRSFPSYEELLDQLLPVEPVELAIGIDGNGNLIRISVKALIHLLMGGTTGSGKTTALESLIFSIMYPYSPDEVKLWIIEPKGVHINAKKWGNLPHVERLLSGDKDPSKVVKILTDLYQLSEQRFQLLQEYGCVDVYEFNEQYPEQKLPVVFLIFDEINQFIEKKKLHKGIAEHLEKLAAFVRAAGIVLILTTQKPISDVVPTNIKANLPSALCLKVNNYQESILVINESGGEKLSGQGDCLFKENGGETLRLQVPNGAVELLPLLSSKWGNQGQSDNYVSDVPLDIVLFPEQVNQKKTINNFCNQNTGKR
jgi:DNA segregation ATPase FtsK/SpoIIIE-like protein